MLHVSCCTFALLLFKEGGIGNLISPRNSSHRSETTINSALGYCLHARMRKVEVRSQWAIQQAICVCAWAGGCRLLCAYISLRTSVLVSLCQNLAHVRVSHHAMAIYSSCCWCGCPQILHFMTTGHCGEHVCKQEILGSISENMKTPEFR